jgi:glycosyltransferase involved in cell wall biosynthesis
MSKPLISVLLPNFNHAGYLGQTLSSILGQDESRFEVLVRDDASTDDSKKVIQRFADLDRRVRAIFGSERIGPVAGVRSLIGESEGQFLCFAAADDYICDPGMFSCLLGLLNMYPSAGMAYGKTLEIHAEGNDKPLWHLGHAHREGLIAGVEFAEAYLKGALFPTMLPALVRRRDYDRFGGFDQKFGSNTDTNLAAQIGAGAGVVYVDRQLTCNRIRGDRFSMSESFETYIGIVAGIEANLATVMKPFDLPTEWRSAYRQRWIDYRLRTQWQKEFLSGLSQHLESLDYWRLFYLPSEYTQLKTSLQSQVDDWSRALEQKVNLGHEIFEKVAGPLRDR